MFDDLFNKFFGRNRKNKPQEPKNETSGLINSDFVSKLMKSLKDIDNFDKSFGPPDKIVYYEQDGVYFKKESWLVDGGEMVHVVGSIDPFDEKIELSYDEQLEIALENENYEEAAILRDKIK